MKFAASIPLAALLVTGGCSSHPAPEPTPAPASSTSTTTSEPLDWKSAEAPLLTDHIQLTSRDMFVKAGEAYFDHHSPPRWVIFQAVPVPAPGKDPEPFYAMYVPRLTWQGDRMTGIDAPIKISPHGSANTCGWFNPVAGEQVIFGSTLTAPSNTQRPGFQVGTRKYIWMFPHEMEIVTRTIPEVFDALHPDSPRPSWGPDATSAKPLFSLPNYDAECSYSRNGRFVLYAHVRDEPTRGKDDADIWVYDTQTARHHELVHADGYDGGPFFSPDNKRICYRSDRNGDDLLQLFVADLKFDSEGGAGVPIGIEREHQVTSNGHVNWAPYWHPSGQFLIYGSSEIGHDNYEVFAVEVPEMGSSTPAASLRHRRITHAPGADVLPVFSDDGNYMMWTAQRGPLAEGETKPSSQVWVAKFTTPPTVGRLTNVFFVPRPEAPKTKEDAIAIVKTYLNAELNGPGYSSVDARRDKDNWNVTVTYAQISTNNTELFVLDPNGNILRRRRSY